MDMKDDLVTVREPLILQQKSSGNEGKTADEAQTRTKENLWMVYLSTFVAVCGSYEFGACVSRELSFFELNIQ